MGETDEQTMPGTPRRPHPTRLSAILQRMVAENEGPLTVAEIRQALGDRSFATLLLLFAVVNLIPILPPGSTAILGLPLVLVSAQMVWGSETVWLPKRLLDVSLSDSQFRALCDKIIPWLIKIEKYIRPRYWPFWPKQGERIVGSICLILSIVVTLPILFGNWLPAFSIAVLCLALTERDGAMFGFGIAAGIAAFAVIAAVIGSAGAALTYFWHHASMWF
jgi:hypothetical protein